MIDFLVVGIILGLPAGLAPGPVLALVISETLAHGLMAGAKVALAPLITDLPLILATLFVAANLAEYSHLLGAISLTGGLFILYLGYQNIRFTGLRLGDEQRRPRSLMKGIVANILNPYPYLFWFGVGAPTMAKAMQVDLAAVFVFLGGFYAALVGSKILVAIAVDQSKAFLTGKTYIYTSRFLGLVLCLFALTLFRDGLKLLGF
jgi:threonine/homoserine/homoserine lactone efflux protein